MTGTSMDGIDISLVRTNGIQLERYNKNYFYNYSNKTKEFLLNMLKEDINFNLKRKKFLDEVVTEEHYKALKNLDIINKSDLIGFHGQTIYHDPSNKISIQLGNPKLLAQMLRKDVIFDFRSNDIEMGGQGAPLAPIYHKHIIDSFDLELPSCILNIGGVANLTFWDGKTLLGYDTGPGNGLMDNFIKKISDNFYDEKGTLASRGTANNEMVKKFINHNYFKSPPPKSLDRNSFIKIYEQLLEMNLEDPDTMASLLQFTIESIIISINALPKKVKSILVTGGGHKNTHLMNLLRKRLDIKLLNEDEINIELDYVESELIAFLSARSIYNLPYTFPSTTGVSKLSTGAKFFSYL